jgi:predicted small lipoprotein YifL
MSWILRLVLMGMLVCSVGACGKKGSLRTPSQIEADEIKAKRQTEREAKKKAHDAEVAREREERRQKREAEQLQGEPK